MNPPPTRSLRRRLVRAIMLSVSVALVLALSAFLVLLIRQHQASTRRELEILAQALADRVAHEGDLVSQGRTALNGLQADHGVAEAAITDPQGRLLVYVRPGHSQDTAVPDRQPDILTRPGALTIGRPIRRGSQRLGAVLLRADRKGPVSDVAVVLLGGLIFTGIAALLSWLLAHRLSRVVMEPILHLADTARRIADRQAVDQCVVRETNDEVGVLVDAFNAMLEQLGEHQSRLEESQRLAHLGHWVFDPDQGQFEWSEETFHILGLDPRHPAPDYLAFRKLINQDCLRAIEHAVWLGRKQGQNVSSDFRLNRADGSEAWVHITCTWGEGSNPRLRGTVMDITERKRSEAALLQGQKLESLGLLAGGIAHDFNNLLAALQGNLDLARTELPDNARVAAYVAKSSKIIERAANLTRQLLAYSGKGQFQVKPLDLTQQVREMGHLLSISVSKKAELRYQVTEGLPAIVGDTSQIQQVIMNLVINASEALGERGGHVTIRTSSEYLEDVDLRNTYAGQDLAPGPYVSLEVEDNGHGMDARTLDRIFDPFFTTKFHGRGLGLAAMLGIVKSHHGAIKVYSEPGLGTTFRLLFPASDTILDKPPVLDPSCAFNRSGRILVVDDEPDIRFAATDIFQHLGFDVVVASDGQEGLERVKEHQGDLRLVLLDLTMPHMNGVECLKGIRGIDPHVPVLMTSGFSETEAVQEMRELNISGFLQKPYSLAALKGKMKDILG